MTAFDQENQAAAATGLAAAGRAGRPKWKLEDAPTAGV